MIFVAHPKRDWYYLYTSNLIYKMFGLVSYSVTTCKCNNHTITEKRAHFIGSRTTVICQMLMYLTLVGLQINTMCFMYLWNYSNVTLITKVNDHIYVYTSAISLAFIIPSQWIRQKQLVKLLNQLVDIDCTLSNLRQHVNWNILANASRLIVMFVLWMITYTNSYSFHHHIIGSIGFHLPSLILLNFILQYGSVIEQLAMRFEAVNLIFQRQLFRQRSISQESIMTIFTIRRFHARLCDIARGLQKCYSLPVTACLATFFYSICTDVHLIISSLIRNTFELHMLKGPMIWCIMSSYLISLLTNNIDVIHQEVKQTGRIVQEMIICNYNESCYKQLKEFSFYLLHVDLKFTAQGLFLLDGTLLHSMMSAVTTYVVIFIQFDNCGSAKKI